MNEWATVRYTGTPKEALAREAELFQVFHQRRAEATALGDPVQLPRREAQILQIAQGLLEAGHHQKPATRRQLAHEELEDRRVLHALLDIPLQHGELVEIGQKRARRPAHAARFSNRIGTAPRLIISSSALRPSSDFRFTARIPSMRRQTA